MRDFINVIGYIVLFLTPAGWIVIHMSYTSWKLYKKHKYNVPNNFFKYLYEHNFKPYNSYRKV